MSAALLAAFVLCAHAADAGHSREHTTRELIDPDIPAAERRAAFEAFDAHARAGDTYAQHVVGSLYRVGAGVEGNPVTRDLDAAGRYLSTAAAHGSLLSMAKMAEIELERKRPLEAMLWAEIYLHYDLDPAAGESDAARRSYPADLLHRATSAFDSGQTALMESHLQAFIALHDRDIRAGMDTMRRHQESDGTQAKITHFSYSAPIAAMANHRNDDLAEYLVAFDAKGRARAAWMLDAVPDLRLGKALGQAAMHVRVNEAERDAGFRYALVPVQYSFGRHEVESAPRD